MKFKAGFFDIGGVLIKYSTDGGTPELDKILGNSDILDLNRRELGKGEINEQQYWEEIIKETQIKYNWTELSDIFRKDMRNYIEKYDLINSELFDYIKELKNSGLIVGTISNTIPQRFEEYVSSGILSTFDVNIASYIAKSKKPNEKIYLDALLATGFQPQDCFFVDDKERNVLAAEKLSFKGILYDFEKNISLIKNAIEC